MLLTVSAGGRSQRGPLVISVSEAWHVVTEPVLGEMPRLQRPVAQSGIPASTGTLPPFEPTAAVLDICDRSQHLISSR